MWDDEPPPVPRRVNAVRLEPLGVTELRDYIDELLAEIARVESAIAAKRDHRGIADSFFKQ